MDVTIRTNEFRNPWGFIEGNAERDRIKELREVDDKMVNVPRVDRLAPRNYVRLSCPGRGESTDVLEMAATRGVVWAGAKAFGVAVHVPGSILVLPADLSRVLKGCREPEFRLTSEGDSIVATWGRTRVELRGLDPALFPSPRDDGPPPGLHRVAAADFARCVRQAEHAADPRSERYALGGILVEPDDAGGLRFVATDGARIAVARCACQSEGEPFRPTGFAPVVPLRAARELADLASISAGGESRDGMTLAFLPGGSFRGETADGSLATPTLAGRFPNYRPELQPPCRKRLRFAKAGDLARTVEHAAITTDPNLYNGLELEVAEDGLRLASEAPDAGWCRVHAPCEPGYSRPPLMVNAQFLLTALRSLPPGDPVEMEIRRPTEVISLRAEGFEFHLMPVQVDRPRRRAAEPAAELASA